MNVSRVVMVMVLALTAGCASMESRPLQKPLQDGLERWNCGDYFGGCIFNCPVRLTANLKDGTGEVRFAGTVEHARFEIIGLERRWDWCFSYDDGYRCSFIINAEGKGKYFYFSKGENKAKPTDLFDCTRS